MISLFLFQKSSVILGNPLFWGIWGYLGPGWVPSVASPGEARVPAGWWLACASCVLVG